MMSFKAACDRAVRSARYKIISRRQKRLARDLSFTAAASEFPDRNAIHSYMHHYFHHLAPAQIRSHREYFSKEKRGFGEDAFHSMWWTLLREYRPGSALEIGVYRGQVISLWGLIAKLNGYECGIYGISPFSSAGDGVSVYEEDFDYLQDTFASNRLFGLADPMLHIGFSTDPSSVALIKSRKWNLIYIDGSHEYEVALADYEVCRDSLAAGGLLVMDDSSLFTDFQPPFFSFAGHPGPSRIVRDMAINQLRFLGGVGHNNVFQMA